MNGAVAAGMTYADMREILLQAEGKAAIAAIADRIAGDRHRLHQLMAVLLQGGYREVQRAAHVISMLSERDPASLQPFLPAMIAQMQVPGLPVAVRRNVVRLLQQAELPEELHGEVMHACFTWLADPQEPVAVRVFSMTVLARLAERYPEITAELRLLLEEGLSRRPSAAFRSRALKTLKAIR